MIRSDARLTMAPATDTATALRLGAIKRARQLSLALPPKLDFCDLWFVSASATPCARMSTTDTSCAIPRPSRHRHRAPAALALAASPLSMSAWIRRTAPFRSARRHLAGVDAV